VKTGETIKVRCSTCGKSFSAPGRAAGRKGPCPKCGTDLTIPSPQTTPTEEDRPTAAVVRLAPPDLPVRRVEPATVRESEYKDCPFCGEEVRARAKKCKHCGEVLDVALRAAEEARREVQRESRSRRGDVQVRQQTYIDVRGRDSFNHGIHIFLDLVSCGFWIPIHLLWWVCWECSR
jgi:predicted RNA-binding Zn-ribbon protein involved in translation (DUF1610 family)